MSIAQLCPICAKQINGDAAYLAYHASRCLDELSNEEEQPPAKRRCLEKDPTDEQVCPICTLPLTSLEPYTDAEIAAHVDACLAAQTGDVAAAHQPGVGAGEEDVCPVCGEEWPDGVDRETHAALCLDNLKAEGGFNDEGAFSMDISPFESMGDKTYAAVRGHKGVIPILAQLLQRVMSNGTSRSACLCMLEIDYINGQITDLGWGCGYRNMQMMMSAARSFQSYESAFKAASEEDEPRIIPSIEELQILIERGWDAGFDPTGRGHFNGKLKGRRKWIGTTEVYVALTVLGFRAKIYDFPKATGRGGTHTGLTTWVQKYFEDASPQAARNPFETMMKSDGTAVRRTDRPPLYLQHEGHSRTIVGIETMRNGDLHLLVFDPSKALNTKLRKAASEDPPCKIPPGSKRFMNLDPRTPLNLEEAPKALEPFRVSIKSLSRNKQYQILTIEPGSLLSAEERAARKIVKAIAIDK